MKVGNWFLGVGRFRKKIGRKHVKGIKLGLCGRKRKEKGERGVDREDNGIMDR